MLTWTRAGVLNLGMIDIRGWIILCLWGFSFHYRMCNRMRFYPLSISTNRYIATTKNVSSYC